MTEMSLREHFGTSGLNSINFSIIMEKDGIGTQVKSKTEIRLTSMALAGKM